MFLNLPPERRSDSFSPLLFCQQYCQFLHAKGYYTTAKNAMCFRCQELLEAGRAKSNKGQVFSNCKSILCLRWNTRIQITLCYTDTSQCSIKVNCLLISQIQIPDFLS